MAQYRGPIGGSLETHIAVLQRIDAAEAKTVSARRSTLLNLAIAATYAITGVYAVWLTVTLP